MPKILAKLGSQCYYGNGVSRRRKKLMEVGKGS